MAANTHCSCLSLLISLFQTKIRNLRSTICREQFLSLWLIEELPMQTNQFCHELEAMVPMHTGSFSIRRKCHCISIRGIDCLWNQWTESLTHSIFSWPCVVSFVCFNICRLWHPSVCLSVCRLVDNNIRLWSLPRHYWQTEKLHPSASRPQWDWFN